MRDEEGAPAGMEVPNSKSYTGRSSPSGGCYGVSASTPPGLWSDTSFSSVVDSSGCSTETEGSEDDDFMAGLAEQMAHSMLEDSDDNSASASVEVEGSAGFWGEGWNTQHLQQLKAFSEADQLKQKQQQQPGWLSTYWGSGAYSGSSSKVSSQVSSPPSTPGAVDDGWDVLHSGGEASNIMVDDKAAWRGQHGVPHLPEVQWTHASLHDSSASRKGTLPVLTKPYAAAVNPQRGWNHRDEERHQQQLHAQPSEMWSRQGRCQQQKQQHQQSPRSTYRCGMTQRPSGHHWQAQSQASANGSGMRAVFLGGTTDRSSCGTGVFLPRSTTDYTSKRKTTCSTVLLPSRIVQVLNLNIEDMRCQPSPHNGNGPPLPPISASRVANAGTTALTSEENWSPSQWKTYMTCSHLHQPSEPTLPTEWSY